MMNKFVQEKINEEKPVFDGRIGFYKILYEKYLAPLSEASIEGNYRLWYDSLLGANSMCSCYFSKQNREEMKKLLKECKNLINKIGSDKQHIRNWNDIHINKLFEALNKARDFYFQSAKNILNPSSEDENEVNIEDLFGEESDI